MASFLSKGKEAETAPGIENNVDNANSKRLPTRVTVKSACKQDLPDHSGAQGLLYFLLQSMLLTRILTVIHAYVKIAKFRGS